MTTRKKPEPVTAPAVPADEAFGNVIMAKRDTAVVEHAALQSQIIARNGQYERDYARLVAAYDVEVQSLAEQVSRQSKIIAAADAALESLKGEAGSGDLSKNPPIEHHAEA